MEWEDILSNKSLTRTNVWLVTSGKFVRERNLNFITMRVADCWRKTPREIVDSPVL